jgi:hypothetical protein
LPGKGATGTLIDIHEASTVELTREDQTAASFQVKLNLSRLGESRRRPFIRGSEVNLMSASRGIQSFSFLTVGVSGFELHSFDLDCIIGFMSAALKGNI